MGQAISEMLTYGAGVMTALFLVVGVSLISKGDPAALLNAAQTRSPTSRRSADIYRWRAKTVCACRVSAFYGWIELGAGGYPDRTS